MSHAALLIERFRTFHFCLVQVLASSRPDGLKSSNSDIPPPKHIYLIISCLLAFTI